MVEKNKLYTIEITDIASDGNGVGAVDGFTVFVPMAAKGDIADVLIVKVLSRYAIGRLMSLKSPSPYRTEPECPHFRRCGGCHLQHMDYAAQLDIKRGFVEAAMRRIGGFENFRCDAMLGMEKPYRYRNKCIFPIGADKNGKTVSGFYARRSHEIIPIIDCLMGDEANSRIVSAVTEYMSENGIKPYDEQAHSGIVRRVFIRSAKHSGEIMVVISVNANNLPRRERLINKEKTNSVLGSENKLIFGCPTISDTLCGVNFNISPVSFYQVNPYMTEKLYAKALEFADISDGDEVIDIYCGIGTISLAAAKRAAAVTGIEISPQAIEDARINAAQNNITNAAFIADSAENAMPRLISGGARPDIVILDPPRKGSDEKTLNAIIAAAPKRIVYISCNPSTLARDAKHLAASGYTPHRAAAVDMFPHTCHVETVCLLSKLKSSEHIEVELNMDELDLTAAEKKATYQEIKDYVLERYGLKVSQLNIAQVKRKYGIIEREN